jgi:hypothetical protein
MITRIKPPKYKVCRYVLNEYELRTLMLEVARGEKAHGIEVKDQNGHCVRILEDGTLSSNVFGTDINSMLTLGILRIRREKGVEIKKGG